MASLILAVAALVLSILGVCIAWLGMCAAQNAAGLADDALDAVTLVAMPPDAVFLAEDGSEIEFRMDRSN